MRIVARRTLLDFTRTHADAANAIGAWYRMVKRAEWSSASDVKASDPRASILAGNRAVFDIRGGSYRLVAAIHYRTKIVFVRFVGTHAEYDDIDVEEV